MPVRVWLSVGFVTDTDYHPQAMTLAGTVQQTRVAESTNGEKTQESSRYNGGSIGTLLNLCNIDR